MRSTIPDDVALLRVHITDDRPQASPASGIVISVLPGTAEPPEQVWTQNTGTTDNAGQVLVQLQPGSYWLRMYGFDGSQNTDPFTSNWLKIDLHGGREESLHYVCPSEFRSPARGNATFALDPQCTKGRPGLSSRLRRQPQRPQQRDPGSDLD